MPKTRFASKDAGRKAVWDRLQDEGLARFPFPPHGRIPNFAQARRAAERLLGSPLFEGVATLKVNPDAPQLPLRAAALARGIRVLMPTPRLRAGFLLLDPKKIPASEHRRAASLSHVDRYARELPLSKLPRIDAIVTGSVAVTREGARLGKGEGYGDLEYAILRELGQPPIPVGTTVHAIQILDAFPTEANDLPLRWIATPDELIRVPGRLHEPKGIDWSRLSEERLDDMPILRELARLKRA